MIELKKEWIRNEDRRNIMNSMVMKKMIRAVIKLLILVVFLGSVMIWIMMPTKTYKDIWFSSIRANTNSTYFGPEGAGLLVHTFPMLFIAVLGCVYLHLQKKCEEEQISAGKEINAPSRWKQPVLVNGPLGIVSWTELTFIAMFVALLVWSFAIYLNTSFVRITPESVQKYGEQVWQMKLATAGFYLGDVGNICLTFLFFPVTRGSSVLPLIGLTSEASIKYHIWLGHITMALFTAHSVCFIIYWIAVNQVSEMLKWDKIRISNVAGELSMLFGLALWATSFPRVRRRMFELFFYTHYLYSLFLIFFILHVGISYSFIMIPGLYLFFIDRYLRFLQSRQKVSVISSRLLPCETLELNFSKITGLEYSPTSIMFINVPSISKLQWHPFTITSNCNLEPDMLSVVIKRNGSWSQKLYQMLSSPSSVERLEVSVEGPYGSASTHLLRHDTLVMASGGSGITPFISLIRELVYMSTTTKNRKTPRILLVCAFRSSADLTMLDLLLPASETPWNISNVELQIEAYVTREKQATMSVDNEKLSRTIWFKPNSSDKPISGILGPNSWLWLGAIIACSFVIFLIILGLLTRFYIYPIDHNTNKIYPSSSRAVLNMLLICLCIVVTSTVVVVKNKKQNAMAVEMQIQSRFPNADKELESLPEQSLAQATNVHFGSRPDLINILTKCEGSSVGVLVCGPRKMRHEVATICSSGLADNLHFESISFSW